MSATRVPDHLCDGTSHVAARADKAADQASAALGHKGHDAEAQAAALLAENGEDDEDGHGCTQ